VSGQRKPLSVNGFRQFIHMVGPPADIIGRYPRCPSIVNPIVSWPGRSSSQAAFPTVMAKMCSAGSGPLPLTGSTADAIVLPAVSGTPW
jgi:hypothetical protein